MTSQKILLEWDISNSLSSSADVEWKYLMDALTELMKKKSYRNKYKDKWIVKVIGFGWNSLDGCKKVTARTGEELLREVLPDCNCTFKIFDNGHASFKIQNFHHDSPTGNEWYYISPMLMKMVEGNNKCIKLKLNLERFTGTEHYYNHLTGLKYTDGIRYLVDKTKSYWFIDIIASYQIPRHLGGVKDVPFQIWKLEKDDDGSALVTMREDTNRPVLVHQVIPYTDFPLDEIEVYCIGNVILLKSEY